MIGKKSQAMTEEIQVYIHGGMHKTGTTTFQSLMPAHHDLLLDHGIYYPNNPKQHGHFMKPNRVSWSPGPIMEIMATAREKHVHKVIFSSETVSAQNTAHIKLLANCFPDCKVDFIFTFRHWCTFFPSRWYQGLNRRDSHSFPTYLARLEQHFPLHLDLQYNRLLDRFRPFP
jgi:hypothetical protein